MIAFYSILFCGVLLTYTYCSIYFSLYFFHFIYTTSIIFSGNLINYLINFTVFIDLLKLFEVFFTHFFEIFVNNIIFISYLCNYKLKLNIYVYTFECYSYCIYLIPIITSFILINKILVILIFLLLISLIIEFYYFNSAISFKFFNLLYQYCFSNEKNFFFNIFKYFWK